MFDPTLYGATLPQRELPFVPPYFAEWHRQLPWQRFVPPVYQREFLPFQKEFMPFQKEFMPFQKDIIPQDYFMMNPFFAQIERLSPLVLPTLARIVFAGVLLIYYWNSAKTKIGANLLTPSTGAYAQIFPKKFEAATRNMIRTVISNALIRLSKKLGMVNLR